MKRVSSWPSSYRRFVPRAELLVQFRIPHSAFRIRVRRVPHSALRTRSGDVYRSGSRSCGRRGGRRGSFIFPPRKVRPQGRARRWGWRSGRQRVRARRLEPRDAPRLPLPHPVEGRARAARRSEEHTSELQSQSNLVCRLLLEKKKKKQTIKQTVKHEK